METRPTPTIVQHSNLKLTSHHLNKGTSSKIATTDKLAPTSTRISHRPRENPFGLSKLKNNDRLRLYKEYYEHAGTPSEQAYAAIIVASIHEENSWLTASRFLQWGPFATMLSRRAEDKAIEWYRRARQTNQSNGDCYLVGLLTHRSSRLFSSTKASKQDHLEALAITAESLKDGLFCHENLVAVQKATRSPAIRSFLKHTICPLLDSYRPNAELRDFNKASQWKMVARARALLKKA